MAHILIIEDDEAMRNLLRQRLVDKYEISDTGYAPEALALALQHKPDAILLDLMLPDFNGFELCQAFSSLSFTRRIPILVITGRPAAEYKDFCLNLGAKGYFEKPVNFDQLQALLAAVLKGKQPEHRTEVRVRLRVVLKLRGIDLSGTKVEQVTITDDVSASGFLCSCTAPWEKDAIVEVFMVIGGERYAGRARVVRSEWRGTPWQRCGFQFLDKSCQWVLQ